MTSGKRQRIKNYKNIVSVYYEVITEPYRRFWGDSFHPAIFENPNDNINTALLKTNRRFVRDSKLKPINKAIDLGCGIGSLACFIAVVTGCEIVGINISNFQLKKAKKLAKSQRLNNVVFKNLDIMDLNKIKEKFDAAFLIDVGCHLPDKEKALKNIFNILNKGGRLVMADWLQRDNLNSFEKQLLIEPFNEYWSFPYMESLKGYKNLFKKIGFTIIKADDVSEKTKKNWDIFYKVTLGEIKEMSFGKMISYIKNPLVFKRGRKFIKIAKNQFYGNLFAKICFDAGVFKYGYFVVEK